MGLDANATPKANGLKTALDTIISPKEAFERLRVAPTWGWALLLTIVLYTIGLYLMTPAIIHGMTADWPRQVAASPQLAAMSPDKQAQYLSITLKFSQYLWVLAPIFMLVGIVVQALVMLVFKAIGRGDAPFRAIWASAVNIALPSLGINSLIVAVIVMVRGADSFASPAEVSTSLPSLAMLVPATAVKLHAFLAAINPFTLWGCALVILAMTIVARVPRGMAWATGIVTLLVSAGLLAMGAR